MSSEHVDMKDQTFFMKHQGKNIVGTCIRVFESNESVIRIGNLFSQNFSLFEDDQVVLEPLDTIPSLSTVVLVPKDKPALEFSKSTSDFSHLFLTLISTRKTRVLCPNLDGNLNEYYVANTTPFGCGRITLETKIIVLPDFKDFSNKKETIMPTIPFPYTSNFVKKQPQTSGSLKISFLEDVRLTERLEDMNYNPHHIGVVSLSTLLSFGSVFNEAWIEVSFGQVCRPIQILSLSNNIQSDESIKDNVIYVSRLTCFNLGIDLSPSLQINHPSVTLSWTNKSQPIIASELILKAIKTPNMFVEHSKPIGNESFSYYFTIPRHLTIGDTFGVLDLQELNTFLIRRDCAHTKYYFKVSSITGNLVDQTTRIVVEGETVSKLPIDRSLYSSLFETVPWKQMEQYLITLMKYQNRMIKNTCSLLLTGNMDVISLCVESICQHFGLHLNEVNCFEILSEDETKTEEYLMELFKLSEQCSPMLLYLKNFEAIGMNDQNLSHMNKGKIRHIATLNNLLQKYKKNAPILVCGTERLDSLSLPFRSFFTEKITFNPPDHQEREAICKDLMSDFDISFDVTPKYLSKSLAGASIMEMIKVIGNATYHATERFQSYKMDLKPFTPLLLMQDFNKAIEKYKKSAGDKIGTPQIPNVTWNDIGGLENAKQELLECIQLPLLNPSSSLKQRSGVLLYGPPGTGKTLLAKAVATECSLNFLSVKGPELINMYVGESERNVREVFKKAREARPCVIFFDELDSLAPNRGMSGDSGGVMDRVVSQLLAELDSVQENQQVQQQVFVIAATNRPDLLDPALLRPGRFDRMVYLGISSDKEHKIKILNAQTRKFHLGQTVNMDKVAEMCLESYTGADYYALCTDALMSAVMRKAEKYEADLDKFNQDREDKVQMNTFLMDKKIHIVVEQEDFLRALENLSPSVSEKDLAYYQQVQLKFQKDAEKEIITLGDVIETDIPLD